MAAGRSDSKHCHKNTLKVWRPPSGCDDRRPRAAAVTRSRASSGACSCWYRAKIVAASSAPWVCTVVHSVSHDLHLLHCSIPRSAAGCAPKPSAAERPPSRCAAAAAAARRSSRTPLPGDDRGPGPRSSGGCRRGGDPAAPYSATGSPWSNRARSSASAYAASFPHEGSSNLVAPWRSIRCCGGGVSSADSNHPGKTGGKLPTHTHTRRAHTQRAHTSAEPHTRTHKQPPAMQYLRLGSSGTPPRSPRTRRWCGWSPSSGITAPAPPWPCRTRAAGQDGDADPALGRRVRAGRRHGQRQGVPPHPGARAPRGGPCSPGGPFGGGALRGQATASGHVARAVVGDQCPRRSCTCPPRQRGAPAGQRPGPRRPTCCSPTAPTAVGAGAAARRRVAHPLGGRPRRGPGRRAPPSSTRSARGRCAPAPGLAAPDAAGGQPDRTRRSGGAKVGGRHQQRGRPGRGGLGGAVRSRLGEALAAAARPQGGGGGQQPFPEDTGEEGLDAGVAAGADQAPRGPAGGTALLRGRDQRRGAGGRGARRGVRLGEPEVEFVDVGMGRRLRQPRRTPCGTGPPTSRWGGPTCCCSPRRRRPPRVRPAVRLAAAVAADQDPVTSAADLEVESFVVGVVRGSRSSRCCARPCWPHGAAALRHSFDDLAAALVQGTLLPAVAPVQSLGTTPCSGPS